MLEELKAKAMAATPGPYIADETSIRCESVGKGYYSRFALTTQRDAHPVHGGGITQGQALANAAFFAACDPSTILKLVAVAQAARASLAEYDVGSAVTGASDTATMGALRSALSALDTKGDDQQQMGGV
jgi:hypothetical protein